MGNAHDARVRHQRIAFGIHADPDLEHALLAAAQERQHPVRGKVAQRFAEIKPVPEVGAFFALALRDLRIEVAARPHVIAHVRQQVGIFRVALCQDVASPVQRRLRVGHAGVGIKVARSQFDRIAAGIGQERVGQGLKAGLAGDLCTRASLGLVRGVEIFKPLLGIGLVDFPGKLRRELLLFRDRGQDRGPAILKLAQIEKARVEVAQHRVVEASRGLLAVARDEGDRRAIVDEIDDRGHLVGSDVEFEGQLRDDARQGFGGNLGAGVGDDGH